MATFEFSIIASGLDHTADDFEDRFYDNGCDDALVSFQKGHIIIDFAREASSIAEAISTAVRDVHGVGARIDCVEPDPLVSLADMAERTGMSRAAMTNYAKGLRGEHFPAPVRRVTSDSPLYDWSEVSLWLYRNKKIGREQAVEAVVVERANEELARGVADLSDPLGQAEREIEFA